MWGDGMAQWAMVGLQMVQFVWVIGLTVVTWLWRRGSAQRDQIAALELRVGEASQESTRSVLELSGVLKSQMSELARHVDHDIGVLDRRLTRVESELGHQLTTSDLRHLHERVNGVSEGVSSLGARISSVEVIARSTANAVTSINDWLRRNSEGAS